MIPEEHSNSLIENKLTMPWLKIKMINRLIIVHKTLHLKPKTEQHLPHPKLGLISSVLEDK